MKTTKQTHSSGEMYDFEGNVPFKIDHAEFEQVLNSSLRLFGWSSEVEKERIERSQSYRYSGIVSQAGREFDIKIYPFLNLSNSSRNRPEEMRIQIVRPYSEHAEDFERGLGGSDKCLLLSLYKAEDEYVFCAWDAFSYLDHSDPTSCYVSISAISDAFNCGFGMSVDAKRRHVCCFRPEFLHYYLSNMERLHAVSSNEVKENGGGYKAEGAVGGAENVIFYGAPGTGKSRAIEKKIAGELSVRTVFHADTQNADFVGALKPTTVDGDVTYSFSPGPFSIALKMAIMNPDKPVYLVIEEINRAPAAAVFGEIFLLLDRDDSGKSHYTSAFPNADFQVWLSEVTGDNQQELSLPKNLWILATMNSADQGVYPLDTAFRRRWKHKYMSLDYKNGPAGEMTINSSDGSFDVGWSDFSRLINDRLASHLAVPEDKFLGPWFLSQNELEKSEGVPGKVLIYLWDDVLRHHGREAIFDADKVYSYGGLEERVEAKLPIFSAELIAELRKSESNRNEHG